MEKLDWEFIDERGGAYQRAEYRGILIEAHRDGDAMNPFTDWDCEPPLVTCYDRSLTDYSDGDAMDPFAGLPDHWFSRNWRKLAVAFGEDPAALDTECRNAAKDWDCTLTAARVDIFRERLDGILPGRDGYGFSDAAETVAALWRLRGVEALATSSSGYCQGDYAELLIVATPEWAAKCGAPRDSHAEQLEAAADLYTAWAWGDVYGFVIKGPGGAELQHPEIGSSVWGFYGSDHGESGLESAAIDAADSILAGAAKRKAEKLKTVIRARVPLHLRPAMLEQAAAL